MSISEEKAAIVLAKSSRHCCLCRNYLPLQIQVHHIVEKSKGGTDDLDNLIPICIQCHSMVHTRPYMTQRYSEKELKKCRDDVYDMVACGKLPAVRPMTRNEYEAIASIFAKTQNEHERDNVSSEALELLSIAVCEDSPINIRTTSDDEFTIIKIGNQLKLPKEKVEGQYPRSIIELLSRGLIISKGNQLQITQKGKNLISQLVQNTSTYTQIKVKCLNCGLHFTICTWESEKHNKSTIFCPECGYHDSRFLVWSQQKFGFIFEEVPGNAVLFDIPDF